MGMNKHKGVQTYYDMTRLLTVYKEASVKCKCGHTNIIPVQQDKIICSWCKNYVYRDKKAEFKDKLLKEIKRK